MIHVSKFDYEQGKMIDFEPTREYVLEKIKETGSITFKGFNTDEEVKEFMNKFPKYTKLKLKYELNGNKDNKKYSPICCFSISDINKSTGEFNELGQKRIKSLLKGLGL